MIHRRISRPYNAPLTVPNIAYFGAQPKINFECSPKYLMDDDIFFEGFAPCLMGLHSKYSKFDI